MLELHYSDRVRSWIPVPGTTTGRLVEAALELFGSRDYASVTVTGIAAHAGVTTGSLYHHFGSKAGLYHLVRTDVERRVVDRLEGAAAHRSVAGIADLAPILLVGFDYLVDSGYARLLCDPPPDRPLVIPLGPPGDTAFHDPSLDDPVEQLIDRILKPRQGPLPTLITAAWRAALRHGADGPHAARDARTALEQLLTAS
jgi:AcrR family transcriptional regulator